jgi:nucleoid-associated protein YgaU
MGLMDFFKKGKEEPAREREKPANVPRQSAPQTPQATSTRREYVIKSGDSLSKIAKQHYGNAGEWKKIYQANRDVIKDPDLIHPGQKIVIP